MIEDKIKSMGILLPEPPTPAGSYTSVSRTNDLLFISGQIPLREGKIEFTGKVSEKNLTEGQNSARLCAINILAQIKNEINLDDIQKIIKISGFVNSEPDFTMHPKVINGASDLFYEIFGNKGRHARVAVGVSSLPFNSMTEIDAIIQVNPISC